MSGTLLRALVVDDEPLARTRLEALIAERGDLTLAGSVGDGEAAVAAIRRDPPDLVLLDVQMPGLGGFEVVAEIGAAKMPPVIFVTAFDHYALDAFAVDAVDYLLKPFEDERFDEAVSRVRRARTHGRLDALSSKLARLIERHQVTDEPPGSDAVPSRFAVHRHDRVDLVPLDDVEWIGAEGAYVRLHGQGATHLVRDTLQRLEDVLAPRGFVRTHRGALVRLDKVRSVHPLFRGDYELTLDSGARVRLSRTYSPAVRAQLGL